MGKGITAAQDIPLTPGAIRVLQSIIFVAAPGKDFTSDDVRGDLERRGATDYMGDDIGNAFRHATSVARLLQRIGDRPSARPDNHRRRIGVYRLVGSGPPKSTTPTPGGAASGSSASVEQSSGALPPFTLSGMPQTVDGAGE